MRGVNSLSPITDADFAETMAPLGPWQNTHHIAVALSGGADSLALTLLARDWAAERNIKLTTLTIDHALRETSQAEAQRTAQMMQQHGIAHHILTWRHDEIPTANLQMEARIARYRLLAEWCHANGATHLLTAHHKDDQAETFLLRLARGSGVDGLSAMQAHSLKHGITHLRPLLHATKAELIATLEARGAEWIEDPTNNSTSFARNRMRTLMPQLAEEGLTTERLAATANRMARAKEVLDAQKDALLTATTRIHPEGYGTIDLSQWNNPYEEISLRALAAIIMTIGGARYRPRLETLERFHDEWQNGMDKTRSIGGCLFTPSEKKDEPNLIYVLREPQAVMEPLAATPIAWWDERFRLTIKNTKNESLYWGALGADTSNFRKHSRLNAAILSTLPALRHLETVIAIPHINYYTGHAEHNAVEARFSPSSLLPPACFVDHISPRSSF